MLGQLARNFVRILEEAAESVGGPAPQRRPSRPHAWRSLKCILKRGKYPVGYDIARFHGHAVFVRHARSMTVTPTRCPTLGGAPRRTDKSRETKPAMEGLYPNIVLDFGANADRVYFEADVT